MLQLQSAFGGLALLAIVWALSENRRAVSLRQAAVGLAVTFLTALVLLKLPPVAKAFAAINTISAAARCRLAPLLVTSSRDWLQTCHRFQSATERNHPPTPAWPAGAPVRL